MITVTEKTSYDLEIEFDYTTLTEAQVDAIFEVIEEFCCENALGDDYPVWETDNGIKTDFCMTSEQAEDLKHKILHAIS